MATMKYVCIAILITLTVHTSFGMEEQNQFVSIQSWQDATKFTGKFVAYKIGEFSRYFGSDEGFFFDSNYYGYLEKGIINNWDDYLNRGYRGYLLRRLINKKETTCHSECIVGTNSTNRGWDVGCASLTMREATPEEVEKIKELVHSGKAEFDSKFDRFFNFSAYD